MNGKTDCVYEQRYFLHLLFLVLTFYSQNRTTNAFRKAKKIIAYLFVMGCACPLLTSSQPDGTADLLIHTLNAEKGTHLDKDPLQVYRTARLHPAFTPLIMTLSKMSPEFTTCWIDPLLFMSEMCLKSLSSASGENNSLELL